MTSVGKRLALNLSRGKSTKKKSSGSETRDELDIEQSAYVAYRKSSIGQLQPGSGKTGKSSSLSNVNAEMDTPLDQEDIVALTQDVRGFSDTLASLKTVFSTEEAADEDFDLKVSAHKELGEVLGILREIIHKYPSLHSTDVLNTAADLITKIKSFNYEGTSVDVSDVLYRIDQLALAFSSSVTEFLMGDADGYSNIHKSKSYDNLVQGQDLEGQSTEDEAKETLSITSDDCEAVLMKLETGVDKALQRAKIWSKYAKDIISYIDKRATLEMEFSKNLSKLAANVRPVLTEDVFLPFQSIYCTAIDHDLEYAETCQTSCGLIQTQKFIEPLNQIRMEHDKTRKTIKENWGRELRKMQEAVANLRKARSLYIQRQQEHDKARSQKAEIETQTPGAATNSAKAEKKKKLEEDAMLRAMEAESTYKAHVIEANKRQEELGKVKSEVLSQIRDLIVQCENTMKMATVAYFQLQHTVSAPLPVQYRSLLESSQQYEPGAQYSEYVKTLSIPSRNLGQEKFAFEVYAPGKSYGERKPSTQSSGSGSSDVLGDDSPSPHRASHDGGLKATKLWGHHAAGSDTDSISESSYKSRESSPSASPYNHRSGRLHTSSSMNELAEADRDAANYDNRLRTAMGEVSDLPTAGHAFRGVNLSPSARTHSFRKLRAPSRCRECDSYVYFQGAECSTCQLTSHRRCLETLHFECGGKFVAERRMTTFGVAFSDHVQETHTEIPHLVTKCTAEIDSRGLDCKGIYRVSGVKSKVEKLCQSFENDEWNVDLSEHPPNVIANVLKLYLRQLPEPLLTFNLYGYLITLAKEEEKSEDATEMVEKLSNYMSQLPKANFRTCAHIMHHLQRVTTQADINQMSASNLGIVFGPTLLRQSEGTASLNSLIETPYQTRIIELLISNCKTIFGPDETSAESSSVLPESKNKEKDVVEGSGQAEGTTGESIASSQSGAVSVSEPWEQEKTKEGSSNEQSESKWYIPPITGDMLAELVQAEPRFQQSADEYMTLPGSTETDARGESSTDDTLTANPDAESDVDGDDLPEALLPDGSHSQSLPIPALPVLGVIDSSKETVTLDSSRAHGGSTSGNKTALSMSGVHLSTSAESESGMNSPGLRRRLLASEVLGRGGSSTFYVNQESHSLSLPNSSRKVLLSKPRHYSPPLQKRPTPEKLSQSTFYVPNVMLPKSDSYMNEGHAGRKVTAHRSHSLPISEDSLPKNEGYSELSNEPCSKDLRSTSIDPSAESDSKDKRSKNSVYV